ncbi:hypothetical protein OH77DRAFT_1408763 [Trametes cingulata]|nr:hypothetical protein OH77DRAFT_1408763 [Trametes cingulata]
MQGGQPAFEELPPPRDIMQGLLVPALDELTPPEVPLPDKPISITGFKCVASYTWLKERNPTIVVPGEWYAREWRDRLLPIRVRFDNGIRLINENGYQMGRMGSRSSFAPLFHAVAAMTGTSVEKLERSAEDSEAEDETVKGVVWADIDFVTDRNNLRKLVRWIRESYAGSTCGGKADSVGRAEEKDDESTDTPSKDEDAKGDMTTDEDAKTTTSTEEWDTRNDFRIDLHLSGEKTILMERWAAFDRERVVPPKGGCRDNFIQESTAANPECENGTGHFRIVQYDLDGLKMVVRWEVDACIPVSNPPISAIASSSSSDYSLPDPPQSVPIPLPMPDIAQLARWDDSDSGGAEAWGKAQPEMKVALGEDIMAKWDDSKDAGQAVTWDVPASDTKPACPTEQPAAVGATDLEAAIAVWDTPADDPVAAAAAWGDPAPPRATEQNRWTDNNDAAAMWGVTSNNDPAAWGVEPASIGEADTFVPAADLTVIRGGTLLPQTSIIELATRSAQYVNLTKIEDTFLQLFLTQTPVNLLAVHTRGSFDRIERQELDSPEFDKVREDPLVQRTLKQLVAFLREIQGMLKGNVAKLSLVCEKGKLRVFNRVGDDDQLVADFSRFGI